MKTKIKLMLLAASLLLSNSALAIDFSGCSVVEIVTSGNENIHVALNCPVPNRPACATAPMYVGFDGTTSAGKYYFSLMSMAFAANLTLAGTIDKSVCAPQGNVALLTSLRATK